MSDHHLATQKYYDAFSKWYERDRHKGYHRFLDDLESSIVLPYAKGKRVLEAGCGTGLIMIRLKDVAEELIGVDISAGMLEKARAKGMTVVQADVSALPFADASFDTLYSFKVLSHVKKIQEALREFDRVVKPGGHLVLEFYNRYSLRTLVKKLKQPGRVSEQHTEKDVYTRYDSLAKVLLMAPTNWRLLSVRGARVFTPYTKVFEWKGIAPVVKAAELVGSYLPLSLFAGFLILVFQKD